MGAEKYGIYQTVVAYVGLFGFLTLRGLNKVLVRECAKDLSKAKEILEDTIGLRNFFSFLATFISIIIVLFVDYDKGTKFYIIIFSFSLIINGFRSSLNTIYQSFENMKFIAAFSAIRQLLIVPLAIFFLKQGYGVLSVLLVNLTVNTILLFFNIYYSRKFIVFNLFSRIKFIKYYFNAGFNFSLQEFFSFLSGRLDIIMLSLFTTPAKVGVYALAYRIVEQTIVIRRPISISLYPHYIKLTTKKKMTLRKLFYHNFIILLLSIFIVLFTIIFSKLIIINQLGPQFQESYKILIILIFYIIFNYNIIPYGLFLQATNNENFILKILVLKAVLNIILNLIFYTIWGLIGIAISTLFNEAFNLLMQAIYSTKVLKTMS